MMLFPLSLSFIVFTRKTSSGQVVLTRSKNPGSLWESMRRLVAREDAPLADSFCQELEAEHLAALSRSTYFGAKWISATTVPSFKRPLGCLIKSAETPTLAKSPAPCPEVQSLLMLFIIRNLRCPGCDSVRWMESLRATSFPYWCSR